ncbi:MAG: protein translocase subunit SecD [Candidatus Vogelbacteria bacterium]|nr:protein translocase subunit SecD [Candidatus Vogelbacteria bacterium]
MLKTRVLAVILLAVGVALAFFVYYSQTTTSGLLARPFKLGLDLSGGSHLVYEANVADLSTTDISDAMSSLREVIEHRINVFGVGEPIVQVEQAGFGESASHRLIVELPGVTDVKQAIEMIDITPTLEFKKIASAEQPDTFISTGLTGRFLKRAQVVFSQQSLGPSISLEFNEEGATRFAEITRSITGQPLAIYLDGVQLSAPIVREEIKDGRAEISGQFTVDEAKSLVRNLNLGALPVPITLASTETIGATLGRDAVNKGVAAGLVGLAIIAVFMIIWYRLPGLVAVASLAMYIILMLTIFKLLPVTLTAAGMAGFILSVGIAVDANVLIFERMKDELKHDKRLREAVVDGFARAWLSIRDSNLSGIISSIILFWFGTSLIKGFALTLALGIVVSLFTAISVTRTLLLAITPKHRTGLTSFLFGSGFGD